MNFAAPVVTTGLACAGCALPQMQLRRARVLNAGLSCTAPHHPGASTPTRVAPAAQPPGGRGAAVTRRDPSRRPEHTPRARINSTPGCRCRGWAARARQKNPPLAYTFLQLCFCIFSWTMPNPPTTAAAMHHVPHASAWRTWGRTCAAAAASLAAAQAFEQNMGRRSSADAKWLQQVRSLPFSFAALLTLLPGGMRTLQAHSGRSLQPRPAPLPARPCSLAAAALPRRSIAGTAPHPAPAHLCRRCGAAARRRIAWRRCRCSCRTARPQTCSPWTACWRWSARKEVRAAGGCLPAGCCHLSALRAAAGAAGSGGWASAAGGGPCLNAYCEGFAAAAHPRGSACGSPVCALL